MQIFRCVYVLVPMCQLFNLILDICYVCLSLCVLWKHSEFPKPPGTNVSEPSPAPLEVLQDNPNHLLQLVSEGDLNGVRLVYLGTSISGRSVFGVSLAPFLMFCSFLCLYRDLLAKAASGSSSISLYSLLEAQNSDGQTALHLACRRGSAELVEAILEYREANVDVLDRDGDPPLVFALAAGSPECVEALIERDANVRSRLREGFGPSVAHVCAYHGQPDCMRVGFSSTTGIHDSSSQSFLLKVLF